MIKTEKNQRSTQNEYIRSVNTHIEAIHEIANAKTENEREKAITKAMYALEMVTLTPKIRQNRLNTIFKAWKRNLET